MVIVKYVLYDRFLTSLIDITFLNFIVERRSRGDLIEVFKASHGLSNLYGVLRFGRSGLNVVCTSGGNRASKIKSIKVSTCSC